MYDKSERFSKYLYDYVVKEYISVIRDVAKNVQHDNSRTGKFLATLSPEQMKALLSDGALEEIVVDVISYVCGVLDGNGDPNDLRGDDWEINIKIGDEKIFDIQSLFLAFVDEARQARKENSES